MIWPPGCTAGGPWLPGHHRQPERHSRCGRAPQ